MGDVGGAAQPLLSACNSMYFVRVEALPPLLLVDLTSLGSFREGSSVWYPGELERAGVLRSHQNVPAAS